MPYFDKNFLSFFKELEKNNHKPWFDENRKRYESDVKKPFKEFIAEMAKAMQPLYPNSDLSKNTSIMRINRDIRFSADKTPYKIHMAGKVSPKGTKDKTNPGLYVQANHKDVRVYSGSFSLEKEQLYAIRSHINNDLDRFNKLVTDSKFTSTFSEILGDKNKRLPPEFRDAEAAQPLIANKGFYWYFKLPPANLTKDSLIQELISRFQVTLPVNNFFDEALSQI
jgi:uncharacterized protein (TIGR02453 family)